MSYETNVRVEWPGTVRTVRVTTSIRDDLTQEISVDGRVIGFIQLAGPVFVALLGARSDRAVECKQSRSWNLAAAQLVIETGISRKEPAAKESRGGDRYHPSPVMPTFGPPPQHRRTQIPVMPGA